MLWITAVNEAILQFATAGLLLGATSVVSWSELYEFCLGRLEVGKDWENLMDFRNKNHTKSRNALTSDQALLSFTPYSLHLANLKQVRFCTSPSTTTKEYTWLQILKALVLTSFLHIHWTNLTFLFLAQSNQQKRRWWWIHGTMIGALIGIRLRKGQDEFTGFITWQRSSWMPSNEVTKGKASMEVWWCDFPMFERWDIKGTLGGKINPYPNKNITTSLEVVSLNSKPVWMCCLGVSYNLHRDSNTSKKTVMSRISPMIPFHGIICVLCSNESTHEFQEMWSSTTDLYYISYQNPCNATTLKKREIPSLNGVLTSAVDSMQCRCYQVKLHLR